MGEIENSSSLSRRTLVGAVWAAPAVALAASVPAFAASGAAPFVLGASVSQVSVPGAVLLKIVNGAQPLAAPVTVQISGMSPTGFTVGNVPLAGWMYLGGQSDSTLTFEFAFSLLPGAESADLWLIVGYLGSTSAPASGTITITSLTAGVEPVSIAVQSPGEPE